MLEYFHDRFAEAETDESVKLAEVGREVLRRANLVDHILSTDKNPKTARRRVDNVEEICRRSPSIRKRAEAACARISTGSSSIDGTPVKTKTREIRSD